ncbi:uncharacterized protein [Montipora foliosa]|uniref:uncharacterized protein isoform X3 n=1 Tax=Montipora foliosa TaxID=591990 RepID=UPI0035F1E4C2
MNVTMEECLKLALLLLFVLSSTKACQNFLLLAHTDSDNVNTGIFQVCLNDEGTAISYSYLSHSTLIQNPVALDFDLKDGKVYFTDVARKTISRFLLNNGSAFEDIFRPTDVVVTPDGLAVDSVGRNLYWTDAGTKRLEVSRLDGSHRVSLITSYLDKPRDIILDVPKGIMYWTDWGLDAKIEKAAMTGKNRVVLVNSNLQWPNGLALDHKMNRLYWVDAHKDKLEYLDLSNNNRVTLPWFPFPGPHPFGLTIFGNHLYWTDWVKGAVIRCNKDTGAEAAVQLSGFDLPMDIHAYNLSEVTTPVAGQCSQSNGNCNHICLLSPDGGECACSGGLVISYDGKTCHDPAQFLLFADAISGTFLKVDPSDSRSLHTLSLSRVIRRPVALGYDAVENKLYWTDVERRSISRSFLNGSFLEVLFDNNVVTPDGLAVDIVGRNIYWTDAGTDKLEVSRMDGSYRTALITRDLDQPRDIVLDSSNGVMFWTDWGRYPKIEKADMTGDNRVVLVSSSLKWPNGLTLDGEKNRLYWVDAYLHKLEYLDLSNDNRVTLINLQAASHPFGLTILGNYLYWSDWNFTAIYQAHKETGGDVKVIINGLGQPMDIHGYNVSENAVKDHSCSSSSGGCSHLCLLSPVGYRCFCPDQLEPGETCFSSPLLPASTPFAASTLTSSAMSTTALAGSPSALMPTAQSVSKLTIPTATRLIAPSSSAILLPTVVPLTTPDPTLFYSGLLPASTPEPKRSQSGLTALPTSFPASLLPSSAVSTTVLAGSPSALMPTAQSVSKLTIPTATKLIAASKPGVLSSASLASLLRSMKKSPTASVLLKASRKSLAASDGFPPLRQPPSSAISLTPVEPSTTPNPTSCQVGTCRNGGTCSMPSHTCLCRKYFAWYDCTVYVGFHLVTMVLTLSSENQWHELNFKTAIANACTTFFCNDGDGCKSKSKADRVKRSSDQATYLTSADVIIAGKSVTAGTLEVEFAVLFPSLKGQPPQNIPPGELVEMVKASKDNIQRDLGITIQSITQTTGRKPTSGPRNDESSQEQSSSVTTIIIAVCVSAVVIGLIIAFAVFWWKRSIVRVPDGGRREGTAPTHMFPNPAFVEDPTYAEIPPLPEANTSADLRDLNSQNGHYPRPQYASPQGTAPSYQSLSSVESDRVRHLDYTALQGRRLERNSDVDHINQRNCLRGPVYQNAMTEVTNQTYSASHYFALTRGQPNYARPNRTNPGIQGGEPGPRPPPRGRAPHYMNSEETF